MAPHSLLVCAAVSVISLIVFPVSESVKKVASMPVTLIPNNTMGKNKTSVYNNLVRTAY